MSCLQAAAASADHLWPDDAHRLHDSIFLVSRPEDLRRLAEQTPQRGPLAHPRIGKTNRGEKKKNVVFFFLPSFKRCMKGEVLWFP